MPLRRLTTAALLALLLSLTVGCTQESRDQIRNEISARATDSTLPSARPSTDLPTAEPPTSAPATSEPPTSEAPTSEPATSEPPTSEPPTSEPATSEPPTSEAPPSEAPSSAPASEPTSSPSAPAAADDQTAAEEDTGISPWWWLVLLALAILAIVVALVVRSRRAAAAWQARTRDALVRAAELSMHLSAASPTALPVVAAQDSGRLAELAVELDDLLGSAKDPADRAALTAVRDQVGSLHRAVDGIALAGVSNDAATAGLRDQAAALHAQAGQAQARLFPAPAD